MGTHSDGRNMCSGDMQSNGETMSESAADEEFTGKCLFAMLCVVSLVATAIILVENI